jgi:hypothetical protein
LLPDDLKRVLSAEIHLFYVLPEEKDFVATCLPGLGRNFFQRTGSLIYRKLKSIIP